LLKFKNAEEQAAWTMAEALNAKGFDAMRNAEKAAEFYLNGKMRNRRECQARGTSSADADIRWSATSGAKKALSDNSWYMAQAVMYHEAASAQYARARYLCRDATNASHDGCVQ
jgi:hypothetical protein